MTIAKTLDPNGAMVGVNGNAPLTAQAVEDILDAVLAGVTTDNDTITGVGTAADPLVAVIAGAMVTPAAIGGLVINWAPAGASASKPVRITTSSAVDLTGLDHTVFGARARLVNAGPHAVTVYHVNGTSAVGNKLSTPSTANEILQVGQVYDFEYDTVTGVYRLCNLNNTFLNLLVPSGLQVTAAICNVATALAHTGAAAGFYGTSPIAKQTGVGVSAGAIHAALVALGLIAA